MLPEPKDTYKTMEESRDADKEVLKNPGSESPTWISTVVEAAGVLEALLDATP